MTNAFVVFHDAIDGAMEVWTSNSIQTAQATADKLQRKLDDMGYEECGLWRAYTCLPSKKVWRKHDRPHKSDSSSVCS